MFVCLQKRLIQEIKMVLRVLVLYIPLPMFWALFDQQVCGGKRLELSQQELLNLVNMPQLHNLYTVLKLSALKKSKEAPGMVMLVCWSTTLVQTEMFQQLLDLIPCPQAEMQSL